MKPPAIFLLLLAKIPGPSFAAATKRNIGFILADDLRYGDLG
jgi:hypothetical protein